MEGNKEQSWRDMFVFYDKEGKGSIPTHKLAKYFSAIGVIVTKKEIDAVIEKYNRELTFTDIWTEFKDKKVITEDEIIQAFKEFDQGGVINANDFKYILTQLGDKLTEAEADKLISYLNKDDKGNIDYMAFMKKYQA